MIGKAEELILLASLGLGGKSTAIDIYKHMCDAYSKKPPSFGAVYTTLGRMARKGWVDEESQIQENGKSRKYFTVTAGGRKAVTENITMSKRLGAFAFAGG